MHGRYAQLVQLPNLLVMLMGRNEKDQACFEPSMYCLVHRVRPPRCAGNQLARSSDLWVSAALISTVSLLKLSTKGSPLAVAADCAQNTSVFAPRYHRIVTRKISFSELEVELA